MLYFSCVNLKPMLSYTILFIYLSFLSTFCTLLVHILFMYYTLYFPYTVFMCCSYTIFIYLYSCTVHFLYCFPVILFIWRSLLCTCICCHILSYDIHILCFSYTILFHILYFSYAFHTMLFINYTCSYTFHVLCTFHILLYYTLLLVLVTVYTFIA